MLRQSTGFTNLKQAEAVRDSLLASSTGNQISGPTVLECIERYLVSREQELEIWRGWRLFLLQYAYVADRKGQGKSRPMEILPLGRDKRPTGRQNAHIPLPR